MKFRNKILAGLIISILAVIGVGAFNTESNATSGTKITGIIALRSTADTHGNTLGYSIGNPNANATTPGSAAKIWNIVQYDSTTATQYTEIPSYCLKAGVGFSDTTKSDPFKDTYTDYYDMLSEKQTILTENPNNTVLSGLVNGGYYNQILAMLDLIYVPGKPSTTESNTYKTTLLNAAGIYSDQHDELLSDDDIEAVQQAALWYYTNHGEALYDKTSKTGWLDYTTDGTSYTSLSDYNPTNVQPSKSIGLDRQQQAELLYNYLITTANTNASKYASSTAMGDPVTVDTTTLAYTESGSNYKVGPIYITKNNDLPYTLSMTVKNGTTELSNYTIQDESGNTITDITNAVGKNFYIIVPTTGITTLNVSFNLSYNSTTKTLWTKKGDTTGTSTQPIVILDKGTKSVPTTLTVTPKPKEFDLALRKYITKVNGVEVSTRTPNIDSSTIATDGTATYKHRKDPVSILSGDVVTYKMTVYNEGGQTGRATKIVDQLPTGLAFKQIVSGDYQQESYDTTTNKLTLSKKGTNNLAAYMSGDPASETVEIECTVTGTASATPTILTNVAWISEEYNADTSTTITNQTGADRDSEPLTTPSVNKDSMSDYKGNSSNKAVTPSDSTYFYKGEQDDDDFEKLKLVGQEFDLALRKYITKVDGTEVSTRVPNIDASTIPTDGTATYKHRKDPVEVSTGSVVTYKITIYNEGNQKGRATKIVDQLPTGLTFKQVVSGDYQKDSYDDSTNKLTLSKKGTDNLNAYSSSSTIPSETVEIECTVTETTSTSTDKVLTNVAWISEEYNADTSTTITNQTGADRDSEPSTTPSVDKDSMSDYKGNSSNKAVTPSDITYFYKGEQDDDDFEKVVLKHKEFDLKLIKRITEVNGSTVAERIKNIDVSSLNTSGSTATTANYTLNKDPITVKNGDIVKYTFRVYNEGYLDGYASLIKEDIPSGLKFLWSDKEGTELTSDTTLTDAEKEAIKFNQSMYWKYSDSNNLSIIQTDYLSKAKETTAGTNLIKAFGANDGTKTANDLSYKEVSVMFEVTAPNSTTSIIQNEACIGADSDANGNDVTDRDSSPDKWVKYEDDEDYDRIKLQQFDLALRKFIVAVSHDETIEDSEYLKNADGSYTRAPVVDTSKLNTTGTDGKMITTATYNHTKEPVELTVGDSVIYMLRVYNEGDIDGYAAEIKDHLPPYLQYVDGTYNQNNGWTVSSDGRTITTTKLKDSLVKKATTSTDGTITLSYVEVPIMCKVTTDAQSNNKITNLADITKYEDGNHNSITDRDSKENNVNVPSDKDFPSYKDDESGTYIPGQEDDDDFEKVVVKIFDLALRKWVSQAIVIDENGQQTVTDTGHTPYDDPEQIAKVEINRKKWQSVTVKFKFGIRVINQGDIEGYAKEITDHVPEGLEMESSENPLWTDEGNNIIKTTQLENTLLKPGDYADIEVLLTWINKNDYVGLVLDNVAEISKDYNDKGIPDIDSIPGNNKTGEDDIDDAPVLVSISTGQERIYFVLGLTALITTAGGVVLIKKFVL